MSSNDRDTAVVCFPETSPMINVGCIEFDLRDTRKHDIHKGNNCVPNKNGKQLYHKIQYHGTKQSWMMMTLYWEEGRKYSTNTGG